MRLVNIVHSWFVMKMLFIACVGHLSEEDGMGFVSPISGVGFTIVVVNSYGTENEKLEEKVEILMYT